MSDSDETQDLTAATALAQLVHFGLATLSPEDIPDDWRPAYEAVRSLVGGGLYERKDTFLEAIAPSPYHVHMELEVEEALDHIENPPQDQLRVYSAWETLHPAPRQDWCIEGVIARPSLNLLVGAPGSKKTWLALDLAVSVASGQPWLGHKTKVSAQPAAPNLPSHSSKTGESLLGASRVDSPTRCEATHPVEAISQPLKPGESLLGVSRVDSPMRCEATQGMPVLIVDEEGGLQRMWDRLGRVIRGHQAAPETPVYFIPPAGYNLGRQEEAESLAARAFSLGVGLIIIDALANVMPRADENNVLSVQPIFANLRRLARVTGAAVLVVHHTNKQGLFRGSTFIASGVDHMLAVESPPQSDLIELATVKARDLAPILLSAQAHFAKNERDEPCFWLSVASNSTSLPTSLSATAATILELLSTTSLPFRELASRLSDLSPGTVRNVLHQLVVTGFVERADGGYRGQKALYRNTQKAIVLTSGKLTQTQQDPLPT